MSKTQVFVDTNVILKAFRTNCWTAICHKFAIETVEKCIEEALTGNQLNPRYTKPSRNDLFALVLAQDQKCPLLTEDGDLRKAATNERVEVHGTVWLVKEMYDAELITALEAESAFDTMRARGSRLPWKEIEKMIAQWKKEECQVPLENDI